MKKPELLLEVYNEILIDLESQYDTIKKFGNPFFPMDIVIVTVIFIDLSLSPIFHIQLQKNIRY